MERLLVSTLAAAAVLLLAPATRAVDVQGLVSFEGQLLFNEPIPGMTPAGVQVSIDPATEATGNGVRCSILVAQSGDTDAGGLYPNSGSVTAELLMERGGPQMPEGACLVTLRASAYDGASTTAHGSTTLLVTAAQIGGGNLSAPVIYLRASKASAELSPECKKWSKKRMKLRDACNAKILKLGGAAAVAKCKDAPAEPLDCDPGQQVDAVLALAHGANDQQLDVASGEAVDLALLGAQAKCQQLFGKAAVKFTSALAARIQAECVKPADDSAACRAQQLAAVRAKLDPIDNCSVDAAVDGTTGRTVPEVGQPCSSCIVAGAIDRKCLKACFESNLAELASALVGDVPLCGDGIPQNGEFCDDGNLDEGDCCSSLCAAEDLGDQSCGVGACEVTVAMCVEAEPVLCEPGDPQAEQCANAIDDDCDGLTDGADDDCVP
jgi:cysteine-rich repeat protein